MRPLDEVLRDYLEALVRLGSPMPRVIVGLEPGFDWSSVKLPE